MTNVANNNIPTKPEMLGIFWIKPDGTIFMVYKASYTFVELRSDYKAVEMSHSLFWCQNVKTLAPEYQDKHYQSIPRGRVIWDDINRTTLVFLHKDFVENPVTIKNVKNEFGISKCDFLYDAHYDLVS